LAIGGWQKAASEKYPLNKRLVPTVNSKKITTFAADHFEKQACQIVIISEEFQLPKRMFIRPSASWTKAFFRVHFARSCPII
jgi:hypothetical protein